jgi:capsular exopolysaccharide synthesis family protein
MLGLLLGVGIACTREYLDRAVRTRLDVRSTTGLPVIGLIPRIDRKGSPVALIVEPRKVPAAPGPPPPSERTQIQSPKSPNERRYTFTFFGADAAPTPAESGTPHVAPDYPRAERIALTVSPKAGAVVEALGMLQTNIAFSGPGATAKTLVFTSPLSGDGKTTTVVNLALSLAERGLNVLLIDADVRRGVVHSVFRSPREPGLLEVLRGQTSIERARRGLTIGDRGVLDYLTTGKLDPTQHGLVTSDAMHELLARAREEYDLVIVDTPPVNIITDAAVLGAHADGVILVARMGVTEASDLSYAVEQLRHVRAPVLGVVLNDIDLRRDSTYDRSYKYFGAYEYGTSDR